MKVEKNEPKCMQIFPLKLQYQKVLNDFFKKKVVITYELHIVSLLLVSLKALKNFIKHKIVAIENCL